MTDHTGTAAPRATTREWVGLALMLLTMLVLASDLTVLFFALPTINADLDPTATQGIWIVHIYGFLIAGLLITMGRLGDRIGSRRLLMIGTAAFAVLSVVAAYSVSAEMLIVVRALLGIAGATLMPSLLALLRSMFRDDAQRRFAIAVIISGFTAGGAIGPLLGGALLEFFWWGSAFLINVPPLVLLLVLGPKLLPESAKTGSGRLDFGSVALSVAGMLAIVFGIQELAAGPESGMGTETWMDVLLILLGTAVLYAFVRRQQVVRDPLFDLRMLRNPRVSVALGTLLLVGMGIVGVFYLITQYLQWVEELSPLIAGLWTLPYIVVNIAGAMIGPMLVGRFRQASVVTAGLVVAVFGLVAVAIATSLGVDTWLLMATASIVGLGHGFAISLLSDFIISGAPEEQAGSAAAAQEVGGELGTATGIAAGGAVSLVAYQAFLSRNMPADIPEETSREAQAGVHAGVDAANNSPEYGEALLQTVQEAFAAGLQTYAVVGAVLTGLSVILVGAVLLRRKQTEEIDRDQKALVDH